MNLLEKCKGVWEREYEAVVIGGSAGGVNALEHILSNIPSNFPIPLFVVQHLHQSDGGNFVKHLSRMSLLTAVEPCDKEPIGGGTIYSAPVNYHMLVECDYSIILTVTEKVNFSRPSIDVLFDSASRLWNDKLIAIILSGASNDGAQGISQVKKRNGLTIAQNPNEAESPIMPRASIKTDHIDLVLSCQEIGRLLGEYSVKNKDSIVLRHQPLDGDQYHE